jgi:hypothetical protein
MLNTRGIVSHAPSSRRGNRASEKRRCKGQGAGAVPRKGGCPQGPPTKGTVDAVVPPLARRTTGLRCSLSARSGPTPVAITAQLRLLAAVDNTILKPTSPSAETPPLSWLPVGR